MASVTSVNLGLPRAVDFSTTGEPRSGIEKHPAAGPVAINASGVAGDGCADVAHHGDAFMRVYAYAVEDYAWWAEELATGMLRPGLFGEQLTTEGIDLNAAVLGETWRIGEVLLQVAHVRTPCVTFQGWMRSQGFEATGWVKRFALAGRPGPYFRVLEQGVVQAGDQVLLQDRPEHGVTVAELFAAVTTSPELLPRVAEVPGLKPWVYERAAVYARR